MHEHPHPRRGEVVHLLVGGELYDFEVEDWWNRVSIRYDTEFNTMVYGHVNGAGRLVYDADLQTRGSDE